MTNTRTSDELAVDLGADPAVISLYCEAILAEVDGYDAPASLLLDFYTEAITEVQERWMLGHAVYALTAAGAAMITDVRTKFNVEADDDGVRLVARRPPLLDTEDAQIAYLRERFL